MIDQLALKRARILVLGLIAAALLYKVLNEVGQGDSSLMFIGVPALLAAIVVFAPPSNTATGVVMKAITLMLLLSAILLIEGAVCILMAAPLFLLIGSLIGAAADRRRKKGESALSVVVLAPILVLSLQGAIPGTSGPRGIVGSAERVVNMTPTEVRQALQRPAQFKDDLPAIFGAGRFPRPLSCRIVDGRYVIEFEWLEPVRHKLASHGKHPARSQLVLDVVESRPGRMVFEPVSDTTMMSHWATLQSSTVEWEPVGDGTRVRWTLRQRRNLDPAWYFGPIQTYAAHRAAAYLIDSLIVR